MHGIDSNRIHAMAEDCISDDIWISMFRNLPNYVFYKDNNLIYRACNKNFANYAGFCDIEDVIGKSDFDMCWSFEEATLYLQEDLHVMQTAIPITSKSFSIIIDGQPKNLLISKSPMFSKSGVISGILAIFVDITEQKNTQIALEAANQKLKKSNRLKSDFIANMSHDLRTPITGILGMAHDMIQIAEQAQLIVSQNQYMLYPGTLDRLAKTVAYDSHLLHESTNELLQLCNQIIEVIKIESSFDHEQCKVFDLHDIVSRNIQLMAPAAQHKKLYLNYHIADAVPQHLYGHHVFLDRIFLNLIGNALKFSHHGGVRVDISISDSDEVSERERIVLKIVFEDTGIGIEDDKFDCIFNKFSCLNPSYKGQYKGSGLGLYTVKQFVRTMEGDIAVESKVGVGTRFILHLPFKVIDASRSDIESKKILAQPKKSTSLPPSDSASNIDFTKTSVLLVEDTHIVAFAVKLHLHALGCHVDVAENGAKVLDMIQKNHYDIVFMDIGLPDTNGIDLSKKIKTLHSPISDIPIIALTGHADDPDLQREILSSGMESILIKPVGPQELASVIQSYIT